MITGQLIFKEKCWCFWTREMFFDDKLSRLIYPKEINRKKLYIVTSENTEFPVSQGTDDTFGVV